jgi:hypothetical protein
MKSLSFIALASLSFATMTSTAQVANAGPDTMLCVDFYTMQGSPLTPGVFGTWTLVSGCGVINNPNLPNTQVVDLCIGENVFVWTVDNGGSITSDAVSIFVYDAAMTNADAGMDQTIVGPQSSAFLSGTPAPIWPATCWWNWVQGNGVVVDPNDPNSMVTGLIVGDNILAWTCDNGPCGTSSDMVTIQMMMATGLASAEQLGIRSLAYDPSIQQLRLMGRTALGALEVVDVHGRSIIQVGAGTRIISMVGQPDGIYIARTVVDGQPVVRRFVVSR